MRIARASLSAVPAAHPHRSAAVPPRGGRPPAIDAADYQVPQKTQRDYLAELLEALSPDEQATLSLAMRVAAPLLDKLVNVAANKPHPNGVAPRRASARAWGDHDGGVR